MTAILDKQIKAIITLLGDSDEKTVDLVRSTLVEIGAEAVPSLQRAGQEAGPDVRTRLKTLVEEIRYNDLEERFREYASREDDLMDLEDGAFLIAQFRYPDLNWAGCRGELDRIAQGLRGRLAGKKRPDEIIYEINYHLYQELGFHGNTQNYYDPDNSYLNRVLDRRVGIPISLSLVYLLIARRLDLPVVGVGLPGHFMLKYEQNDFCAFLDAFNKGQALTREECVRFLLSSGYEIREGYFAAANSREVITRILRNLVYIYNQRQDKERARRLTRLTQILQAPGRE